MEQVLNQLPKGWINVQVKDVTKSLSSGFACNKSFETTDGYVHLRTHNISTSGCLNFDQIIKVSHEKIDEKKSKIFKGEILFNNTNSKELVGKTAYVDQDYDFAFSNHLTRIVPNDKVHSKFLVYWLVSLQTSGYFNQICKKWIGQAGVNNTVLKGLSVPLPSKEEQKRIVEKLDALLTRIDTAIEHLQESVTLADALVKSSLSAMLTKQEHWDKVSLSDVCQITSKLCDPREEQYLDMFHIGGANIASFNGELIGLKTAREEKLISGKFPFDNSMVLYSKIRPYLMKVARPSFSGICSADIYPLTPDNQKMSRDFLFYLLLSDLFTQYAIEGSSRAGMPKVNRNHLFNFEFYLPPIDEQKSICESLDALVEKTNEVSKELTGKLSYLAGLKASILDSAFKGEL
ncbi:TPA: restriction endonuclease subunit S [Vibrio parahaemolyticus]